MNNSNTQNLLTMNHTTLDKTVELHDIEVIESVDYIRENFTLKHPAIAKNLHILHQVEPFLIFDIDEEKEKQLRIRYLIVNDEDACYTNGKKTVIGINHSTFSGDLDDDYRRAVIVQRHESAHDLFTDEEEWSKACYRWVREFMNYGGYARDLMNIYEDRRIEYLFILVRSEFRKDFLYVGSNVIKDGIKNAEKMLSTLGTSKEQDAAIRLMVIRNLILWSGYTRLMPKTSDSIVNEYMKKIFPIVLYSRDVPDTGAIVKCVDATMNILKDLLDIVIDKSAPSAPTIYIIKPNVGSKNPIKGPTISLDDLPEGSIIIYEEAEKIIEENTEDENDNFFGGSSKKEEDEEKEKKEEGKGGSGSKSEGGEEEETESKQDSSSGGDESSAQNAPVGEGGNINDVLDSFTYNDHYEHTINEEIEKATSEVKAQEEISVKIYNEYLEKAEKKTNATKDEFVFGKILDEIGKATPPDIHAHCVPIFKAKQDMDSFTYADYEALKSEVNLFINDGIKKLKEILALRDVHHEDNLRSGKVDRSKLIKRVAFGETKIFEQREEIDNTFRASFMLLVDESGSQGATVRNESNGTTLPRYALNRLVSIVLHEILKGIRFDHSVWSFYSGGRNSEHFASIIDRSNCFEKHAGLRLKDIGAKGSNRDGYSIFMAGEYLKKQALEENKILFVLSDGQPAASNYGGAVAVNDMVEVIGKLKKEGVKVIGIFTGSEHENELFSTMYENCIFVNNESIYELPNVLKDEIIKLIAKK